MTAQRETGPEARFRLGYCRGLDGLRGIAVLAVLLFHTHLAPAQLGYVGVQVFFALSGFLITSLLVEEWDQFQGLKLGKFYLRRVLRLFPALVLMLAVFVLYRWLAGPAAAARAAVREALTALFYSSNWACALGPNRPYFLGHTWSLSIEEQFYLLWPPVLWWALRRKTPRASLVNWLLLGFVLAIVNRCLQYARYANPYRLSFGTDTQADALLLGCALAVALASGQRPLGIGGASAPRARSSTFRRLIQRGRLNAAVLFGWLGVVALAGLLWLGLSKPWHYGLEACLGYPLVAALSALLVLGVVASPSGLLSRLLANPVLVWVGKVSYGLYLWHAPVLLEIQARHWPFAEELAAELGLTLAFVLASYYGLERPVLRFKTRFARV